MEVQCLVYTSRTQVFVSQKRFTEDVKAVEGNEQISLRLQQPMKALRKLVRIVRIIAVQDSELLKTR